MEVIYSLSNIKNHIKPTNIALGTFDGLHRGHMELIKKLILKSKINNYTSVVYTFLNHPREITSNKNNTKRIINSAQKIELFEKAGVDILVLVDFDEFHRNIEAEDFIRNIFVNKLNMKNIVVGFDCRFGKNAEGDLNTLKFLARKYDFDVEIVQPIKIENKIVSSTLIRYYLSSGEIEKVNFFLNRPYEVRGKVIKGKQLGKTLGFPTANILLDNTLCLPKSGVYATKTMIGNDIYFSITNVGINPTFNQKNYNIETYIFDFNENIYNQEIKVFFYKRLRDEFKFGNIDDLCNQINNDIIIAKDYFSI